MHIFTTLTDTEFSEFSFNHPLGSFHETVSWGKLKKINGWDCFLVGVKEDNKVVGAALLLKKNLFLGYNLLYSPRGFLLDYNNKELVSFFTEEIKKFAKKQHSILVKIDPPVINYERDIDGNIVEGGINNNHVVEFLKTLNYRHNGFNLYMEDLQPRWIFYLDVKNKTSEEVLLNMEPKTRQLIRRNIRNGLKVRELSYEDLSIFKDIMNHTSKRRGFIDRPFSYYQNIKKYFNENAKYMITEIDMNEYIKNIDSEILENTTLIDKKEADLLNNKPGINIDKTKHLIDESKNNLIRLNKKKEEAILLRNNDGEIITLGGILFLLHGKEVLSLFGGAYDKYMDFYSPYTLNYEMIKYAIENNYDRYNFYGITGDFKNTKTESYGLYDFKRGFGGQVGEYIGEFDLIINPFMHLVYKFALKIYNLVKRLIK